MLAELERLNRLSLTRSFTPQTDLDWTQETTEGEYESLYPQCSLFAGTGRDHGLSPHQRAVYVRYQQINLMKTTALLERHGISALARLYDQDSSTPFADYVSHFIKEEVYHYAMFQRAAEHIQATMPGRPPLPMTAMDRTLRTYFHAISLLPGWKLRSNMAFLFFRFAEQLTMVINQFVGQTIKRKESLVRQVWAFHAMDEARHLAFDEMILEKNKLWRPIAWLPAALAIPPCAWLCWLVNCNEVWIARQVGLPVGRRHLPSLIRNTRAPFKLRMFQVARDAASPFEGASHE